MKGHVRIATIAISCCSAHRTLLRLRPQTRLARISSRNRSRQLELHTGTEGDDLHDDQTQLRENSQPAKQPRRFDRRPGGVVYRTLLLYQIRS